jgi:selenide,water dikinase
MVKHEVHSATDVTGYGLLGHVYEMADGSEVTIRIFADKMPLLPQALELADAGMIPGGANDNREFLSDKVRIADSVPENYRRVAFDPQTSGGLLIAIDGGMADEFRTALEAHGLPGQPIGQVEAKSDIFVILE